MSDPKKDIEEKVKRSIKKKLHDHSVEEKILAEIDKDLDRLIEFEVKETIEKEFNPLKETKAEDKSGIIVEKNAEDKEIEEEVTKEKREPLQVEEADEFTRPLKGFQRYFHICWKGICRPISWVMIVAYLIIVGLMALCSFFNLSGVCISQGPLGASTYIGYVSIAAFLISIVLSFLSPFSRTALIFSVILSIPLLIIVFVSFVEYIGLILIFLVFFNFIIQGRSSGY